LNRSKQDVLAWESRWSVPAGLFAFAGVIAAIVSLIILSNVHGENSADLLEAASEHSGSLLLGSVINAIGFALLTVPLFFLFRAASARSPRMRAQLVGVIIAGPLFFALSTALTGISLHEAANTYTNGNAKPTKTVEKGHEECVEEQGDKGQKSFAEKYDRGANPLKDCERTEQEDSAADNARGESTFTGPATGFELAGRIGLAFALGYTCLYAMRVGLLTRAWGALGIALGVVALLLVPQFTLILFIYLGLLFIDKLPRGKPVAWAAGEAVPWPTPGERVAKEIEPKDQGAVPDEGRFDDDDEDRGDDGGSDAPSGERTYDPDDHPSLEPGLREAPEPGEAPEADGDGSPGDGPQRRKRKRRG
jgi:hypothetical protein